MEVNPTAIHRFWLPSGKYDIIKQIFNLLLHVIVLSKNQVIYICCTFKLKWQISKFEGSYDFAEVSVL
jgi:hypothetical protein